MQCSHIRNENWYTKMDAPGKSEMIRIQTEIARLEHAVIDLEQTVIRFKSACLSAFCRPIDRENLINAQFELSALQKQLSSTFKSNSTSPSHAVTVISNHQDKHCPKM